MHNNKYLQPNWQNREELESIPTRNGYGDGLVELGQKDENVVVLCADLTESTRSLKFKEKFPERFVECGVSEQNMVGVAAGMASTGKLPFVSSYAMFCPGLTWVQIRTLICYNEQKIIIAGAHSGISVGPDGATHQAIEDIAIMRSLPNMTIVVPGDANETRKAVVAARDWDTPMYIRFGRSASPVFSKVDAPFQVGKATVLRQGADVTLVACGALVYEALLASEILASQGIHCDVINMHTVKPLDIETLLTSATKTRIVVTLEEHQRMGGLGSAVAEVLGEELPVPIRRLGIDDEFGESGEPDQLLEFFGLTAEHVARSVQEFVTNIPK